MADSGESGMHRIAAQPSGLTVGTVVGIVGGSVAFVATLLGALWVASRWVYDQDLDADALPPVQAEQKAVDKRVLVLEAAQADYQAVWGEAITSKKQQIRDDMRDAVLYRESREAD